MIILQALYLMLPAYLANMAPVIAGKIWGHKFSQPLDFGKKYQGRDILGKNKTWRGLLVAVIVAIITVYLQQFLMANEFFGGLSLFDYTAIDPLVYGFLLGFGVILGDAVKSFFKRRKNLKPGDKWMPWDQLDFLGALFLLLVVYQPVWQIFLIILLVSPLLPMATNWLGFKLHIKNVSW